MTVINTSVSDLHSIPKSMLFFNSVKITQIKQFDRVSCFYTCNCNLVTIQVIIQVKYRIKFFWVKNLPVKNYLFAWLVDTFNMFLTNQSSQEAPLNGLSVVYYTLN